MTSSMDWGMLPATGCSATEQEEANNDDSQVDQHEHHGSPGVLTCRDIEAVYCEKGRGGGERGRLLIGVHRLFI